MLGQNVFILNQDDLIELTEDIKARIKDVRGRIQFSKLGLDTAGNPTKSAGYIRARETRNLQLLCLIRDLIAHEDVTSIKLGEMAKAGLEKLVYPMERLVHPAREQTDKQEGE